MEGHARLWNELGVAHRGSEGKHGGAGRFGEWGKSVVDTDGTSGVDDGLMAVAEAVISTDGAIGEATVCGMMNGLSC